MSKNKYKRSLTQEAIDQYNALSAPRFHRIEDFPDNPIVKYTMTTDKEGTRYHVNQLWIDAPYVFVMANLNGTLPDQLKRLDESINGTLCKKK
jgi:hypothetical protein